MKNKSNNLVSIQNNMQKGESISFSGKEGIDLRGIRFEKKDYETGISIKKEDLKKSIRYTIKVPKE